VGLDDRAGNSLSLIPFAAIKGGKPFDIEQAWFRDLLRGVGQLTEE
jgi:pyrophosphate--fructose-6-phosphate 1-phosphotransferase